MYTLYLARVPFPVPPSKIDIKVKGDNKAVTLANGEHINLLKTPDLSEISMTLLLPATRYPFASYPEGFRLPAYYLEHIETLAKAKKPFWLQLARSRGDGAPLHSTEMEVSIESYSIADDAGEGFDTTVQLSLKQFLNYHVGLAEIKEDASGGLIAVPQPARPVDRDTPQSYTVLQGDTLLSIAKSMLGSDVLFPELAKINGIPAPCKLAVGAVLRLL